MKLIGAFLMLGAGAFVVARPLMQGPPVAEDESDPTGSANEEPATVEPTPAGRDLLMSQGSFTPGAPVREAFGQPDATDAAPAGETAPTDAVTIAPPRLDVRLVLITGRTSLANLGGVIARPGDRIAGVVVTRIDPTGIEVEWRAKKLFYAVGTDHARGWEPPPPPPEAPAPIEGAASPPSPDATGGATAERVEAGGDR
ncbi:MAG: hypothetical protein HZB39_06365 [Planctomycetes bacterium]|nr:hypothetical protein [Planctomycetota bacterium]